MVGKIKDYEFQTQCVEYLIDKTVETSSKQVITVKAPTGAGKTIILIKYVDEFLKNTSKNTAFVWLCPGKGNLEEQSKERMEQLAPHIDTRSQTQHRRWSKWTIKAYHTLDGNANITSFSFQNIGKRYCMGRQERMYVKS